LVVGKEGSGKSTLSIQMGSWIDPQLFVMKIYVFQQKNISLGLKV